MADKTRTEPDWQDLRAFLALARHGSLSAAARTLSVNHVTVARRIHALEAALNEKLVERRPEGYVLTSAGSRALEVASDMETAVQTLGRGETDGSPKGLVRVNAAPALAHGFLATRLTEIAIAFPGLDIDLAAEMRAVSLERHETDIAVRFNRPQDGDVIAKPLVTMGYGFYGIPSVCKEVENGTTPVFIGFNELNAHLFEAAWLARHFPDARLAFRTNNQVSQALAVQSGVALALLPHYVGRMQEGLRLCRLEPAPPSRDLWLVIRSQDRKDVAIRTVTEHLTRAFAAERALFED